MPMFVFDDIDLDEIGNSVDVPNDLEELSQVFKTIEESKGQAVLLTVTTNVVQLLKTSAPSNLRVVPLSVEYFFNLDLSEIVGRWFPLHLRLSPERLSARDPLVLYAALLDANDMYDDEELRQLTMFVRDQLPLAPVPSWRRWAPLSTVFDSMVTRSLEVLTKSLDTIGYEHCCVCFNGGKDCTVAFDLTVRASNQLNWPKAPRALILITNDEFEEVLDFVTDMTRKHNSELIEITAPTVKQALRKVRHKYPEILACVMGTRRSDPGCERIQEVDPTDPGWPSLLRINPIIDWTYSNVWEYIDQRNLCYCLLYDQGYTSIGPKSRTRKNSQLLVNGEYAKAAELVDSKNERRGRT